MKKRLLELVSVLIVLSMLCSAFSACTGGNTSDETTGSSAESKTDTESSGNDTDKGDSSEGSEDSEGSEQKPDDDKKEEDTSLLNCDNAAIIEYAESIKNGVNYYYPNYKRESAIIENAEMSLEYQLAESGKKMVSALKNKNGIAYVENTMDIFVRMKNGYTYLASTSKEITTSNLFRLGYYFYEARFEGQDFISSAKALDSVSVRHKLVEKLNSSEVISKDDDEDLTIKITSANDPYLILKDHNFYADDYNLMEVTMKADISIRSGQVFVAAGSHNSFSNDQRYKFNLMADGEYHTYVIPLYSITDYSGKIRGIRFDIDGPADSTYSIKEIKLIKADIQNLPAGLSIARSFMTYTDKMHHVLQVSARSETTDIDAVGMITNIPEEKVAKLVAKDKDGIKYTLSEVDWASAEYVGFDIVDAGIFGYILPADNSSGSITVTLENGIYTIIQESSPENGVIIPSEEGTNNGNDFYMGQRIYTDDNHNFKEFLFEADQERNPIDGNHFRVDVNNSRSASYGGYDALRGIYVVNYKAELKGPTDYPNVKIMIRGNGDTRKIYVMAYSDSSGVVECSLLLDDNDMLLPVPIEVGKNFSESGGERNLYNIDDPTYSESIFPLVIEDGIVYKYNVVNIYKKWGNFPVKQISWIQFWAPYYHLSTGVTETNCITPYYTTRTARNLSVLPDFRSMSAPTFSGDQKNSGGKHIFLQYVDADGNYVTSENTVNTVGSHGPTYADVTMSYLSDDGKIKITYNHMEMPQTDENRTYYEMSYEILEDISFRDFAKDFSFYSVSANPAGIYTLVGYLDENNESKVVDAKRAGDEAVYYTLGYDSPYFSYMNMINAANPTGYINLAFLVRDYEISFSNASEKPRFVLADLGERLSISLDLGEITLKKGDYIKINSILLPWGSQDTIYDGSNGLAADQNVRDVRHNTFKNPATLTPVENCKNIESTYVPMIKTTNGKDASFTISGGHNNIAIRLYGFDLLTVPKIYELVGGEWVPYRIASAYYSYNHETSNKYDGYGVYYDGDGTFSYSFIIEMDNGAERTFKFAADAPFTGWSEIDHSEIYSNAEQNEYINLIVQGEKLFNATDGSAGFSKIEYLESEGATRFYADPSKDKAYFVAFQTNNFETGDYFVMKYRVPEESTDKINTFLLYTSTTQAVATYENHHWSTGTIIRDGKWHTLVIDISEYEKVKEQKFANQTPPRPYFDTFPASETDGLYYASFLRVDLFNKALAEGSCVDIQYVGFSNDIEKIIKFDSTMSAVHLSTDGSTVTAVPTGFGDTNPNADMNVIRDGKDLYDAATSADGKANGFGRIEYIESEGITRFHADPGSKEAYFNVFTSNSDESGQYFVLKYRVAKDSASSVGTFKFHTSTSEAGATGNNGFWSSNSLINDGQWHVLVIDVSMRNNSYFAASSDGKYYAVFARMYVFGQAFPDGTYVDIQYIGMTNSLQGIKNYNSDMKTFQLSESNGSYTIIPMKEFNIVYAGAEYIDSESVYKPSDNQYVVCLDSVNSVKANAYTISTSEIVTIAYNQSTTDAKNFAQTGSCIVINGWAVVEGSVSKYLWTVDGKNWYDCALHSAQTPNNCGNAHVNAANSKHTGEFTFSESDTTFGNFQGSARLVIDLADYAGETVNVTIAAAPADGEGELCILTQIMGVNVTSAN